MSEASEVGSTADNAEKVKRPAWQERSGRPVYDRAMTKREVLEFAAHLAESDGVPAKDVTWKYEHITDITDQDRDDCVNLHFMAERMIKGVMEVRIIFTLKQPVPEAARRKKAADQTFSDVKPRHRKTAAILSNPLHSTGMFGPIRAAPAVMQLRPAAIMSIEEIDQPISKPRQITDGNGDDEFDGQYILDDDLIEEDTAEPSEQPTSRSTARSNVRSNARSTTQSSTARQAAPLQAQNTRNVLQSAIPRAPALNGRNGSNGSIASNNTSSAAPPAAPASKILRAPAIIAAKGKK